MNKTIAAILFIWAGLLFGVSFVATPAKFLAPSLPMAQALDVGRWTFQVLAWVEWTFAGVSAALIAMSSRSHASRLKLPASLIIAITCVLAAESFVLRPLLDARVLRIIGGESLPASAWHNVYIALEILRLALILTAATGIAKRLAVERAPPSTEKENSRYEA